MKVATENKIWESPNEERIYVNYSDGVMFAERGSKWIKHVDQL